MDANHPSMGVFGVPAGVVVLSSIFIRYLPGMTKTTWMWFPTPAACLARLDGRMEPIKSRRPLDHHYGNGWLCDHQAWRRSNAITSASDVWPKSRYHSPTARNRGGCRGHTNSSASYASLSMATGGPTGTAHDSRSGSIARTARSAANSVAPGRDPVVDDDYHPPRDLEWQRPPVRLGAAHDLGAGPFHPLAEGIVADAKPSDHLVIE